MNALGVLYTASIKKQKLGNMRNLWLIFYSLSPLIIIFADIINLLSHLCNTGNMGTEKINRLKIVLVEQGKTGKWLAGQLGKNEATILRWCSNTSQPSLEMLMKIAAILNVDARRLINDGINKEI